jgi:hypothetical protein
VAPWDPSPTPAAGPSTTPAPTGRAEGNGNVSTTGTTTNGLRKRVPGDRLAAGNLTPMIRRGTGGPPPGEEPPSDSAAADSMFSLLTSFESGVERGLSDLAATAAPEPTSDDHQNREV